MVLFQYSFILYQHIPPGETSLVVGISCTLTFWYSEGPVLGPLLFGEVRFTTMSSRAFPVESVLNGTTPEKELYINISPIYA